MNRKGSITMKAVLRISELAKHYPASGIRKMFDLAADYDDVIALTPGEPSFETPAYIKEAAKKALDENFPHYSTNAGLPVLRQAVADCCQSYWTGYKADNVVVTVGALKGLILCLLALLNPGDEILVPDPCFANYYGQAMIAKPKGSFYAFVNIKAFGKTSQEFAEELIRGARVICVPGTAFCCTGPIWFYKIVEALIDAGVYAGFSRADSRALVIKNMLGVAQVLDATGALMTSVDAAVKKANSTH